MEYGGTIHGQDSTTDSGFSEEIFRKNRFAHGENGFKGNRTSYPAPSRVLVEISFDQVRPVDRLLGRARPLAMLGGFLRRRGAAGKAVVGEAN